MRIIILCLAILFVVAFGVNAHADTGENHTKGEINWSRPNYKITNSTATATIIVKDSDMNKIANHIDTLRVNVFSDTYPEGITLELYETEKNSGQFERSFTISEERFAPSILYMKEGDTLTAKYVDHTLPISSNTDSLEMIATTIAGHSAPPLERIHAKSFELQDWQGNKISDTVKFGQQIELTSSLANQYNKTQNFVYLVQISNQHEQTVSLSWINGTMFPYQKLSTSQSWIPTKSGSYHAVVFVWESLTNPSALSPPLSMNFEVSSQIDLTSSSEYNSASEKIFAICQQDDDCMINALQQLAQTADPNQVLHTIDSLLNKYTEADFYCHPMAHHMGEFLYGYLGRDLDEASQYVDSRCASGILHGLVENTIAIENLLYDTPIDEVDYVGTCNMIEEKLGGHAKKQCIHGIGHSIIRVYDYDTVEAVKECNEYNDDSERFMCRGGLFMQNIKKYSDDRGGDFDESDPYYPCNEHKDYDADLCYRYLSQYFLINNDYDAADTFSMCDGISEPEFAGWCYKGTGSHLAKEYFYDVDRTAKLCDLGDTQHKDLCIKGAVESITLYVDEKYAPKYCNKIDSVYKTDCINRMNQILDSQIQRLEDS